MNERYLMEEMLKQMKKQNEIQERMLDKIEEHNKIQEKIEREMELQNNFTAYYLKNGRKVSNAYDDIDIYDPEREIKSKRQTEQELW